MFSMIQNLMEIYLTGMLSNVELTWRGMFAMSLTPFDGDISEWDVSESEQTCEVCLQETKIQWRYIKMGCK